MARGKRISSMTLEQIRVAVDAQQKRIETLDTEISKLDATIKTKRKERNLAKIALKNMIPKFKEAEAKAAEAAKLEAQKADAEELLKLMMEKGLTLDDIKAKF